MLILDVYKNNHPVLRKKSRQIEKIDSAERVLFESMLQTMYTAKGVGFSAPQAGILKQMIVVDIGTGPLMLANPRIIDRQGKSFMEEGCLSLPQVLVNVKRAEEIDMEALDKDGNKIHIKTRGLLARVIQHELDHLNGILIIDYLPWYNRLILFIKMAFRSFFKSV